MQAERDRARYGRFTAELKAPAVSGTVTAVIMLCTWFYQPSQLIIPKNTSKRPTHLDMTKSTRRFSEETALITAPTYSRKPLQTNTKYTESSLTTIKSEVQIGRAHV